MIWHEILCFLRMLHSRVAYFYYFCTIFWINMATKNLNRIKVMLAERNQTNKWLAEQVGKDPATVSKWVTNASQPSLEMIFRIAELLKCNYTDLIRDVKEQNPITIGGKN